MNNQDSISKISDFVKLRKGGYMYVDKTMYISAIEQCAKYIFFIRPHGFGMSTLISMLMSYYDINMKDSWSELFSGLYVGQRPTTSRSSFVVVNIDFSKISGNLSQLKSDVDKIYHSTALDLIERYRWMFSNDDHDRLVDVVNSSLPIHYITELSMFFRSIGHKVYMFIDRYDCVIDCIMKQGGRIDFTDSEQMENLKHFYRFFDALNTSSCLGIERIFATGTLPMTIQTMLSGFDKGLFCTTDFGMSCMAGFTDRNVRDMLMSHKDRLKFQVGIDELEAEIKNRAGGYCFSPECTAMPQMYNPGKVMAFMDAFEEAGYRMPASTSRCDICQLLTIRDSQYDAKTSALKFPFMGEDIVVDLESVMLIDRLYDSRCFISMLYYFGLLTIKGSKWNSLVLGITNEDSRRQIATFLDENGKLA
ncbi:MAG: AAA family ATPase [Bacteroidales bacterium]|nr:AAA family ATPase [Bacteroidales bacterium]